MKGLEGKYILHKANFRFIWVIAFLNEACSFFEFFAWYDGEIRLWWGSQM